MRFAIISDTHDNLKTLEKIINWLNEKNIALILHCGDIATQETINFANNLFKGEIKYVKGNADYNLDIPNNMKLEIGGKKIAFVHFPNEAKKFAESGKFDFVFYGHTHKPWDDKIGNCHLTNPGESAGQFYKPTFAVYDTDKDLLELKVLENL